MEDDTVQKLFRQELIREVKDRPGYRPDDRIGPFRFVLGGPSLWKTAS